MQPKFAHLHVHSHYSLLGALPKIPQLVARAKAEGCTALALTDLGNLYGAIEFYKECKNEGIKPIIGLEALVDSHNGSRILLYAENEKGYKNLLALVTAANFAPHEGKPFFSKDLLAQYKEGLVAVSPAIKGVKRHHHIHHSYRHQNIIPFASSRSHQKHLPEETSSRRYACQGE